MSGDVANRNLELEIRGTGLGFSWYIKKVMTSGVWIVDLMEA